MPALLVVTLVNVEACTRATILPGMKLLAEIRHLNYGSAMFVKHQRDLRDIYANSSDTNIETVTKCLPEISIPFAPAPSNGLDCHLNAGKNLPWRLRSLIPISQCGDMIQLAD